MALLKIGDIVLATGGGGGGTSTALYNSSITATATASATATYTMVQKPLSAYDDTAVLPTATGSATNPWGPTDLYRWGDVSGLSSVAWSSNLYTSTAAPTAVLFTGSSGPGWMNSAVIGYNSAVGTGKTNWTATSIQTAGLDAESTVGFGLVRYWGTGDGDIMSSEMHGGVMTGTSLPYPDRPETEDVTASASSVSEQYISSNGFVVDSTLAVSPELTTASNAFALSDSQPGSLVPRTYNCMMGLLKRANFPAGYPDTAYSASNFASGATATGVTGLF